MPNELLLKDPRLAWKQRLEVGEAAEVLGVDSRVIRALLELGILAGNKPNVKWAWVDRSSLEALLRVPR